MGKRTLVLTVCAAMALTLGCSSPGESDVQEADASPAGEDAMTVSNCPSPSHTAGVVCDAAGACARMIRVLSYNVHALPEDVSGENPKDRLRRIGEILAAQRADSSQPDFVLLQEAFDKADRIIDRAGFAQAIEGPTQIAGLSGGLFALTDHSIVGQDRQSFEACAGVDCLAEKGVLGLSVTIDSMPSPITILTTHLQAQSENDAVRVDQINELLPYLEAQAIDEVASIFAGDFNFKAKPGHDSNPSYEHFVGSTPYTASGQMCLSEDDCDVVLDDEGKSDENDIWLSTNDHQFHHAPAASGYRIRIVRAAITYTETFEGEDLSDHYGREFDYCVEW